MLFCIIEQLERVIFRLNDLEMQTNQPINNLDGDGHENAET